MPELPEVEHTRACLTLWLGGRTLSEVTMCPSPVLRGTPVEAFRTALRGVRIQRVERRGKWLWLVSEHGLPLYVHLGMTGKWLARDAGVPRERFELARLEAHGNAAIYVDARKFGSLALSEPEAIRGLGPDPLLDGIDLTRVVNSRRAIKEALLDQSRIAGLGNIHVIEALWRAELDPAAPANTLSTSEQERLALGIDAALRETLNRYASAAGPIAYVSDNRGANPFRIYGQGGRPCPRCDATLATTRSSGRGTTYCPRCQCARGAD